MNASLRGLLPTAALAAALLASGCATMAEGRPAPPVQGDEWIAAGTADPASLAKNRWLLLVVFRPGSEACAEGMAEIRALREKFGSKGLVVLGVSPADREDTEAFLHDAGVDFPVLADGGRVIDSFGIPEVNGNHTYLIDPPGVVVAQGDIPAATRILDKYLAR